MNLAPYLGSIVLLAFAAGLVGVTHLSMEPEGPLFDLGNGKRTELLFQIAACAVAFVAGWQL